MRNLPVGCSFELVRVLRSDSLRGQQLSQRRVHLNLSTHEGVELSGRSRVLGQLFLHNFFDHFTSVGDIVNLLCDLSRNNDDTILVTNNSITGANRHSTDTHYFVACPWLHSSGALARGGAVAKARETITVKEEQRKSNQG